MISRKYGFELGVALPFTLACLTFTTSALAQDPAAPPTEADTSIDAPPAGDDDPLASPMDTGASELDSSEPAEPEVEAEVESDTEPAADLEDAEELGKREPPESPEPTASGLSSDREDLVTLLGLEHLPGSAYPEPYTRGLKLGSLWLTFHGHQWPYMPMISDKPGLRIGVSGYLWSDLSNARISVDERITSLSDQNRWVTQTRGIVRVTPTYNAGGGWFVQGNAEVVIQGDMRPDPATGVATTTDDVWVRFGKWDLFDVTVGRFQAWEIANHYGMALDWATLERQGAWVTQSSLPRPTDGYGLSYFWDRQNFLLGTYAAHFYPTKYLRAEVLGHIGAGPSANAANPYQMDIRPSAIFDIGWLKLKAGFEYGKATPQDERQRVRDSKNGYGFAAQFVFAPYVEFGGSFARGFQDVLDQNGVPDLATSNTVQTFGGFVNVSPAHEPLLFGFGAFWNSWENMRISRQEGPHYGKVDTNDQQLIFGAVQYAFWERFFAKLVLSHAKNSVEHFNAGTYTNEALSARLRLMLLY